MNSHNVGYAQNFSLALSRCTGDLVFLSDQDDIWLPEKLGRVEALAQKHPTALCIMNDAFLADESLKSDGRCKLKEIRARGLSDKDFVMGCCAMFRRSYLELALPVPGDMRAHDNWLVQLADLLGGVLRVEEPLQLYRLHESNNSDFFVNSAVKLNWIQRLSERLIRLRKRLSSGGNFNREIAFSECVIQRLTERRDYASTHFTPNEIDKTISSQEEHLKVLLERRRLRNLGYNHRLGAIYRLYRRGGYTLSGGPLGAAKDLLLGPRLEQPE